MAWWIFNCDWLDLGTGPEAARLDVSYTWDKFFNVGIKAAVFFTKGLHCMHWHACGPLSCTSFDPPDDTDNQICLTSAFSTIRVTGRAARTHIGRSRMCAAAGLGIQEITLETWQTNTRRCRPDLQHQPPGSTHFCKQKVGVGCTNYIYRICISILVYPIDMTHICSIIFLWNVISMG